MEFFVNDSLSRRGKLDFGLQSLCFIRLVLITHAFVLSEVWSDIEGQDFMSLLPKGQEETWRVFRCRALIEQQFEFLWHQQKFTNQQQCEALKRAVGLMKQLNRQLQSTWINSAYIKKISQQQFPLGADSLSSEFVAECGQSAVYVISSSYGLEQAVVNCTINGKGCHHNTYLFMRIFCKHFTRLIKETFEISFVTYLNIVIVTWMVIFNVKISEIQ